MAEEQVRKAGELVEKKRRMVELMRDGERLPVIAERLGVSTRNIKRWVKKLGLTGDQAARSLARKSHK